MERGMAQPTVLIAPSGEPHSQLTSSLRNEVAWPETEDQGGLLEVQSGEDSGQNRQKTKLHMEGEPRSTRDFVCHG